MACSTSYLSQQRNQFGQIGRGQEELLLSTSRDGARGESGGRGWGAGEPLPEELQRIEAKNLGEMTRSHIAKSLRPSKRHADLHRVLLPDAPPRKRCSYKLSPERDICMVVPPESESAAEPPTADDLLEGLNIMDLDVIIKEGVDVEVASPQPTTSTMHINVQEERYKVSMEDGLLLTDSDEEELENNIDNSLCLLPTLTGRDATTEPACEADMTLFQFQFLRLEDEENDRILHDIVSDISNTFNWKRDHKTFTGRRETFTGTPGPTFPVKNGTTVLDVFYRMIDTEFIDLLCTETNRYAEQQIATLRRQNQLLPNSRLHRWTPTDRDEMVSFLAIMILQGLYPQMEEDSYFCFNGFGTMPYFARIMAQNRHKLLKSFLHFVDNETLTNVTDELAKLRPVVDYFNDKFSSLYMPSQDIAIDESLLKWRGRLSFSQKIATKAAKVGVKTYELCESSSGYLWKFFVYVGKNNTVTTGDREDDERPEKGENEETDDTTVLGTDDARPSNATAKVVFDLLEPLLNRGHTVVMDNFYNSPLLLRCLKSQKTDCYGTLRLNREFVPDSVKTLIKTDLRKGEIVATYCTDLSIMVWRDHNMVSMISTYHNLEEGTQVKNNRIRYKPKIVLDYNKSRVDRKDQFLSAQPRNRIWYKKLFRRLFSVAMFNCFVIFGTQNPKMSHRQFRRALAEDLLKTHRQIDLTTEPRLTYNTSTKRLTETRPRVRDGPAVEHNHFPVRKPGKSRFRCWWCAQRKVEARTTWKCMECDVYLCIDKCFREYHKRRKTSNGQIMTDPTDQTD